MKTILNAKISDNEKDWVCVRECFVESFFDYSLYKYIAQNPATRAEFLRRYFDANYDAAVRQGKAILCCLQILKKDSGSDVAHKQIIIGGTILMPPSSDKGCSLENSQKYWDAYENHKLREVDSAAYDRLLTYERWENLKISQSLSNLDIPAWNGLFLAIKLEYTCKGYASLFFANFFNLITQIRTKPSKKLAQLSEKTVSVPEKVTTIRKKHKIPKILHIFSLLSRHTLPTNVQCNRHSYSGKPSKTSADVINAELICPKKLPILIILSHQQRSSKFYHVNGCSLLSKVNYTNELAKGEFEVDVLAFDPFAGKRLNTTETL